MNPLLKECANSTSGDTNAPCTNGNSGARSSVETYDGISATVILLYVIFSDNLKT